MIKKEHFLVVCLGKNTRFRNSKQPFLKSSNRCLSAHLPCKPFISNGYRQKTHFSDISAISDLFAASPVSRP